MQKIQQNSTLNRHNDQYKWLDDTLGYYLRAREQAMYDEVVADIFGV